MLKNLFSSQVRIDLLSVFLMHPGEEFYLRELAVKLHYSPRSIDLELRNLSEIDLVHKRISGKQHYYCANLQHPIYSELRTIFVKTVGLKQVFHDQLLQFNQEIRFAFIYGSMAKGSFSNSSDIDVMIIGRQSPRKLASEFSSIREKLGREVNFHVFSQKEIGERVKKRNHFISSLLKEPMLFIIGNEDEFRGLVQKWLAEKTSNQS